MVEIAQASSSGRGDPIGEEADNGVVVERREKFSAVCKWQIKEFSKMKQRTTRCLYSKYFEVGGFDCRLLVYPAGIVLCLLIPLLGPEYSRVNAHSIATSPVFTFKRPHPILILFYICLCFFFLVS